MPIDPNQLLNQLPAYIMQHNRNKESDRRFNVEQSWKQKAYEDKMLQRAQMAKLLGAYVDGLKKPESKSQAKPVPLSIPTLSMTNPLTYKGLNALTGDAPSGLLGYLLTGGIKGL